MTQATYKIHSKYNADHDVNPDQNAPPVTWAEEALAHDIDALVKKINALETAIEVLEAKIEAAK